MTELAKSGFRRLRDEFGVTLDPENDLDVIENVIRLADKVIASGHDWHSRAILKPAVRVGNLVLRRMPIGAQEFMKQVNAWFPDDDYTQNLSLAFCMSNQESPSLVWGFDDPKSWKKMIRKWSRGIEASYIDLLEAICDFQDRHESDLGRLGKKQLARSEALAPPSDSAGNWGPIIEILVHEYGKDPETWIWKTPFEEIELLLDSYVERMEEAARGSRKADGSKRAVAPDPDRPRIIWMRRFQMYVDQVGRERGDL